MKTIFLFLLLMMTVPHVSMSQTLDEWTKQKKTQRKYLLQQIAKLQAHLEAVKKGYDIVKSGLNTISQIKRGDLDLHQLFFGDLFRVKGVIKNYTGTRTLIDLYHRMISESSNFLSTLDNYSLLASIERAVVRENIESFRARFQAEMKALLQLLSDDALQMNDEERIKRIDQTIAVFIDKQSWLRATIQSVHLLHHQRQKNLRDYQFLQKQF